MIGQSVAGGGAGDHCLPCTGAITAVINPTRSADYALARHTH